MWPFKPKPWTYSAHEYVGVENDAHTYRVTFKRGKEERHEVYRFHARTVDQAKDETKLVRFFTADAGSLE